MPSSTRLRAGLIGAGIQASKSPALHMDEGREHGLDISYELLDLDFLEGRDDALLRLLNQAEEQRFVGLNITHPCKQSIIPLLTSLAPEAEALGAVNTVVLTNGKRLGYNTDWIGFTKSLARSLPQAKLDRVLVLGAGGGGASVAYALLKHGAGVIVIHDTNSARSGELIARLSTSFEPGRIIRCEDLAAEAAKCDGIVNCTPIGMHKYPGTPMPLDLLHDRLWIGDIVYFPIETEFLKSARARGCATLDGGGMVVFQAAEGFRLFTGQTPDTERMLRRFPKQSMLSAAV